MASIYTHPPKSPNLHEVKINIQDACESVNMQMLCTVWNEIHYHFDMCKITKEAHIEIK
jgi:hypothetical protein